MAKKVGREGLARKPRSLSRPYCKHRGAAVHLWHDVIALNLNEITFPIERPTTILYEDREIFHFALVGKLRLEGWVRMSWQWTGGFVLTISGVILRSRSLPVREIVNLLLKSNQNTMKVRYSKVRKVTIMRNHPPILA
ncbi:hypothetical protein EI94DRAFT_1259008 [Lactarius quietus]|nr:hypothetical protein EI94DRAFT_1259008 [Lactarius quietus]